MNSQLPAIKASEIGSYLYCQRAWSYQRRGMQSANIRELEYGIAAHEEHGRGFRRAALLRRVALALITLAILLLVLQLAA